MQPIRFSWVRLPGDPADSIAIPPSQSDIAALLPGTTKPDSLILCYTGFMTMSLPGIGLVVAMLGEPEHEQDRQYGMLVGNLWICLRRYHAFECSSC